VVGGRILLAEASARTLAVPLAFAAGAVLASIVDTLAPEAFRRGGPATALATSVGHRRRLLAIGGPLLLPLTVLLWAVELVLGFALLYLPAAEGFFSPDPSGSAPFVTALYVSGYSASTLGVGDVYPQTGALRLLTTTEAALGFAVFSVSIAYLLSVYGALRQSKALALEISRFLDLDHQPDGLQVLCRPSGTAVRTSSRTACTPSVRAWCRSARRSGSTRWSSTSTFPTTFARCHWRCSRCWSC
jgi:hypothetical protein